EMEDKWLSMSHHPSLSLSLALTLACMVCWVRLGARQVDFDGIHCVRVKYTVAFIEEVSGLRGEGSEPGAPLQDYRLHVQAVAPEQALTPPPSSQMP
ncbi:hypothetical protein JOQ06_026983, partial [Pogonophryne albipinna]